MRIKWLRTALHNLDAEAEYIARDNPAAAVRVVQKIRATVNLLAEQPALGRPGRVPNTRELVISGIPYLYCTKYAAKSSKCCGCYTRLANGQQCCR